MPSTNELLSHPEISAWLQTHVGAAEELQKAAAVLGDKPDGIASLNKLLPALSHKVVFVFFSYKDKDERAAKAIVNLLRKYSAEKLKITYQAEFTKEITGRQWRQKIKEEVCRANWFLLLLPDPSDDWDWCLYETGLFDRQANSADRVICLHHPDTEIPDPIKDYHAVPATIPKVEEFLRMVYLEDNPIPGLPAINKAAEDDIPTIAKQIVEAIRPPRKDLFRRIYEPWVELSIENADRLENRDDLDKATVRSANREALRLFDLDQQPGTWGELRRYIEEPPGDSRWREEMLEVIGRIAQGRRFDSIQAVFQASNGQIYRPVACAIDRVGPKGPIDTFHFTFTQDVAAIDSTAMPQDLADLATVLRFVFRFRWEVLEKFGMSAMTVDDVGRLENALQRMEKDWESRGMGDKTMLIELFPADRKPRVVEMLRAWEKTRNKERTGQLDVAIAKKDPKAIPVILKEFIGINQEFLEMLADRFRELISV